MSDDTRVRGRLDALGYPASDPDEPGASRPRIDWSACLRCGQPIESLGEAELRTGGMTGAAHLLLGQLAELGEGKLRVEILACPACGHLELRTPG